MEMKMEEWDDEFQICGKCGWDAINEQYNEPREPNQQDFDNGEADILTGRWI